MKLAFHRSVPFWLGLFVLAFLFWAWADSRKQITSWSSNGSMDPPYWIHSCDSGITFGHTISRPSSDPFRPLASDNWYWRPVKPLIEGPFGQFLRIGNDYPQPSWFPPFQKLTETSESSFYANDLTEHKWIIPYWLILLLFTIPWIVLLFWWARRRKRLGLAAYAPLTSNSNSSGSGS